MISNPLTSRQLARELLLELCPAYIQEMPPSRQEDISKYFVRFNTEETLTRIRDQHNRFREGTRNNPEIKRPVFDDTARYRMEAVDYIFKTTGIEIPFSLELPSLMYENIADTLGI